MNVQLQSKIILGTHPSPDTVKALRKEIGKKTRRKGISDITMCVFEVTIGTMVRYCCWAGGRLIADPDNASNPPVPSLTLPGQAAVEAMLNMPFIAPTSAQVVFAELRVGKTPLQEKIVGIFENTPPTAVIVFFGDLAEELDGKMGVAFNWNGAVELADCVGITSSLH